MDGTTTVGNELLNFGLFCRKMARESKRITKDKLRVELEKKRFFVDSRGYECIDPKIDMQIREIEANEEAIREHGNNPDKRLDSCGFSDHKRKFMMTYDYKKMLPKFDFSSWDWLVLHGNPGTGKTTLATRLAWEWMKDVPSRKATFLSIPDWFRMLQDSIRWKEKVEHPKFRPFVILDDFDKFKGSEWKILQLFELIDSLYRQKDKKVVITCNKTLEEILKKYQYDIDLEATFGRIKRRASGIFGLYGNSF